MSDKAHPRMSQRLLEIEGMGEAVDWIQRKARATGREDLIWMEISESNFETPPHIMEAGRQAIDQGLITRMTAFEGLLELREAVADKLADEAGVRYDPVTEIMITSGTAEADFIACQGVIDPGDEIIVSDPYYLDFLPYIHVAGGTLVRVPLVEEEGWKLDIDALRDAVGPNTKGFMLNSPLNPTGTTFAREELEEIAKLAIEHNLWVMYDMLFDKMVYDDVKFENPVSIPGMKERTLLLSGWSKVYGMCGFRVGWLAGNAEIVSRLTRTLHLQIAIVANAVAQKAAVAALRGPQGWWQEWLASYKRRRDFMVPELNSIPGVTCQMPQGGFWAFPNMSAIEKSSYKMAERLLHEAGVVVGPGADWGTLAEGHLRIVYGRASEEDVKEGTKRIKAALM